MASGTCHDGTVPLLEEPEPGDWLIDIKNGQDPETREKPLIQEVDKTLRDIESNKGHFNPLVVSFGPYHHKDVCVQPMNRYKVVAARWFFSRAASKKPIGTITIDEMKNVYSKFVTEVTRDSSPKKFYDNGKFKSEDNFQLQDFFLDGCFILYFIHLCVEEEKPTELLRGHLNPSLIARDMFLLENQIPYTVLKALMSLMLAKSEREGQSSSNESKNQHKQIVRFIHMFFIPDVPKPSHTWGSLTGTIKFMEKFSNLMKIFSRRSVTEGSIGPGGSSSGSATDTVDDIEPLHLLDLLRLKLIGNVPSPLSSVSPDYYFRSIMELREAGIKVRQGESSCLKDVKFVRGCFFSHLHLPPLLVDDETKSLLLNLIAYEACPDGPSDRTVTSYVCFLDSLIDHAKDVKELRSKNVLLNRLGSDEEVAKLFNELATNLTPYCSTYDEVATDIESHTKNSVKVWIAQFMHTHFSSPWTVIALIAGIFVIALTMAQTIYSAGSYYEARP